jgi:hypothetical protein
VHTSYILASLALKILFKWNWAIFMFGKTLYVKSRSFNRHIYTIRILSKKIIISVSFVVLAATALKIRFTWNWAIFMFGKTLFVKSRWFNRQVAQIVNQPTGPHQLCFLSNRRNETLAWRRLVSQVGSLSSRGSPPRPEFRRMLPMVRRNHPVS